MRQCRGIPFEYLLRGRSRSNGFSSSILTNERCVNVSMYGEKAIEAAKDELVASRYF